MIFQGSSATTVRNLAIKQTKCTGTTICSHCAGSHKFAECDKQTPKPVCANCTGPHRHTSPHCPKNSKNINSRENALNKPPSQPVKINRTNKNKNNHKKNSYSQAVRGPQAAPAASTPVTRQTKNTRPQTQPSQDIFEIHSQEILSQDSCTSVPETPDKSQNISQERQIQILQQVISQLLNAVESKNLLKKNEITKIKRLASLR